ncbi:MAG: amidohydrolase family protein [Planctomycetota bacterium]|nr:amidohydrolase family protein [Planctomycetota bacterium]
MKNRRLSGRCLRRGALLLAALPLLLWLASGCIVDRVGGAFAYQPAELAAGLSPEARGLLARAMEGVDPKQVVDFHVHLVGTDEGGHGCRVHPDMTSPLHPLHYFRYRAYLSASGVEEGPRADDEYLARFLDLAHYALPGARFFLLPFEAAYGSSGVLDEERTPFQVPNAYAREVVDKYPDTFLSAVSVHPYRADALEVLAEYAASGARLVKWLPNSMGMDPADPACDEFYSALKEHGMALLVHVGQEEAFATEMDQELANPLRLRRPLDAGVKVIAAHCGSLGTALDLDDPARPQVPCFQLFLRLMGEERYRGLLFGEISAVTQVNRYGECLETLLERRDLHPRLVHGSDYPLPALNIAFQTSALSRAGFLSAAEREALNEIYNYNPLLFDLVLKRTVRSPGAGDGQVAGFPASVFLGNPALPPEDR